MEGTRSPEGMPMLDLYGWETDYFDPAYLATADGIRELQAAYDDCPIGMYPDMQNPGCEVLKLNPIMCEVPAYQRIDDYVKGMYFMHLRSHLEHSVCSGKVDLHCGQTEESRFSISDVMVSSMYKCRGVENDEWVSHLKRSKDDPVVQVDVLMSAKVTSWNTPGTRMRKLQDEEMLFRLVTYMNMIDKTFVTSGKVCLNRDARRQRGTSLDDYLIPYLSQQDMDKEAERILEACHQRVTNTPVRLDVKRLLDYLGMEVCFVRIAREFKYQGRVFFEEGDIEVYDASGRAVPLHVRKGTILIDERILDRAEAVIWTIVHECYHYIQHKEFFYLQKIYDGNLKYLSYTVEDYKQLGKESPVYWAEWQTDRMTARMLVPARTAKPMAERLLRGNASFGKTVAMEKTIQSIASFYGVSKQTAKYRMLEMGFQDARGVFNYVDKGYVPAYYGTEYDSRKGTPDIPEDAALELYISDTDFRGLIDRGRYCFVENHFCVRDEQYITSGKNGEPCLTPYARNHIDECCIIFERVAGERLYTYKAGAFNNEIIYCGPELYRPIDIPGSKPMPREKVQSKRLEIYLDAIENTPLRFGPALKYHREHRKFSQETLADLVSISSKQISNYENSKVKQPETRTVIAMCIAMKLETDLSDEMLKKGACTPGTEREDLILLYVLHTLYEYSISYCNRFLREKNVEPLTKDEDDEAVKAS